MCRCKAGPVVQLKTQGQQKPIQVERIERISVTDSKLQNNVTLGTRFAFAFWPFLNLN